MRAIFFFLFVAIFLIDEPVFANEPQKQSIQKKDTDKPWRKKNPEKEKKKKKSVSDTKKFKQMSRELLGRPHWSERFLNLLDQDTPKIAIHPFKEEDLPIALDEAQIYVDGFTRALIREADERYAIVGRKELGAVINDINEMGSRSDSINPLGDLIDRARSDLLAVGNISLKGDKIVLAYKLVETETGRIVSASQKAFKRKMKEGEKQVSGLSLKGAAQKAAHTLMRDVVNVRKIMVQGLRYQTSGAHSDFGRYFMEVLSDQLRKQASSGPRNINDLNISEFVIEEETFRGLKLASGRVEEGALRQRRQDYLIKGTYWVFDEYVEIRLTLESENGKSVSWRDRVIKSEIPKDLEMLPPPAPIAEADNKTLGPIDLYLTSNKGQNPLYKVGEEMILAVRVAQDSYLYCYYLQADGQVFRILPNRFVGNAKLNGGFLNHIPAQGMPFSFEFSPPTGVEAVKCYATDRDVMADVVSQTGKAAFEPIPLKNERELTKLYRSLPNTVLSEASLIVTVH